MHEFLFWVQHFLIAMQPHPLTPSPGGEGELKINVFMLKLNVDGLLESRGITKTGVWLAAHGINRNAASRLVGDKAVRIDLVTLEKLCLAFNCTPDELFVWLPEAGMPEDHPLKKLKLKPKPVNPIDKIKKLPAEKLEKLHSFLEELEKNG